MRMPEALKPKRVLTRGIDALTALQAGFIYNDAPADDDDDNNGPGSLLRASLDFFDRERRVSSNFTMGIILNSARKVDSAR